ncbi:MAG: UDP-glucose/GDP-mannose dehydrogenase family protein [Chloroflexota bacterium]|nr:UDP-glucose/GDP-mannose dehydrogenase family protein [Chloroflexota bacterium]
MIEATKPPVVGPREPIGVVGAGYVGLVTAVCFATLGHRVTVRDIDPAKIAALQAGEVPIYEPGLTALLAENTARISFTLSMADLLSDCRLIFVAVDTPPTPSGDADLSKVMSVLFELAALGAGPEHVVVMKSTVPVGTGRRIRAILRDRGLPALGYVSNPEFLREGTAITDFMKPDRVVIGALESEAGDLVEELYRPLEAPILRTSVASAEMIKYASNAFLATKISFINEIANVCEEVGADVDVVSHGMGMDPRIGPAFLRAGIGYGGSCFPKDVAALKQLAGNSGYHFQLLTSVIEVNELQKRRVINKLKKHLGSLEGKQVALLGLAFKPGTDDMREAASVVLVGRLLAEGATVRGYDPVVNDSEKLHGVEVCISAGAALMGADAAILVTEWPELVNLDWANLQPSMRQPVLIDGRNVLDPRNMRAMGYTFEGIGRQLA